MLETKYFLILVVPKVDIIEWDRAYNKRIVYIYIYTYIYRSVYVYRYQTYTIYISVFHPRVSRESHLISNHVCRALCATKSVTLRIIHVFFFFFFWNAFRIAEFIEISRKANHIWWLEKLTLLSPFDQESNISGIEMFLMNRSFLYRNRNENVILFTHCSVTIKEYHSLCHRMLPVVIIEWLLYTFTRAKEANLIQ